MLGKAVVNHFSKNNMYDVYGLSKDNSDVIKTFSGDLTDKAFLNSTLSEIKPEMIIHCAANVNLEDCEKNQDLTFSLHVKATIQLASFNSAKTKFVYISTDSVFNGQKGGYIETDMPNPINYYATTKLEGEKAALTNNPNTIVTRTNMFGINSYKKKSLAEWAIQNLSQSKKISGFSDVFFNPLYTMQLASVIEKLLNSGFNGIINAGSKDYISKYSFLAMLSDVFGFDNNLIEKAAIDDVVIFNRPKNTTLKTDLLNKIISFVPDIYDGIKMMKNDFDVAVSRSKA